MCSSWVWNTIFYKFPDIEKIKSTKSKMNMRKSVMYTSMHPHPFFLMVKTIALYLLSIKSFQNYSRGLMWPSRMRTSKILSKFSYHNISGSKMHGNQSYSKIFFFYITPFDREYQGGQKYAFPVFLELFFQSKNWKTETMSKTDNLTTCLGFFFFQICYRWNLPTKFFW